MTLRDLRQKAKEFDPPIPFDKTTSKEELELLIAGRMTDQPSVNSTPTDLLEVGSSEEDVSPEFETNSTAVTQEDLVAVVGSGLPVGFIPLPSTPTFSQTAATQNPTFKSLDSDETMRIHENNLDMDMIAQPGIYCYQGREIRESPGGDDRRKVRHRAYRGEPWRRVPGKTRCCQGKNDRSAYLVSRRKRRAIPDGRFRLCRLSRRVADAESKTRCRRFSSRDALRTRP